MCSVRGAASDGNHALMQPEQKIIAEWLTRMREHLGWTWKRWADAAEIGAPTTLSRAVKDDYESITGIQTLHGLARAAGVPSVLDFLAGQGVDDGIDRRPAPPPAANDDDTVGLRRFDLSYAMGPGTNIDHYVEEDAVRFDLSWLRTITRAHTDMLFVAKGDGDSMAPTLINDDTVLIDTSQRELNLNDRIWAVSVYGAGMIKRIRKITADRVAVLSDNKDVPPQEVDMADLHIVGRVVWVGRRV